MNVLGTVASANFWNVLGRSVQHGLTFWGFHSSFFVIRSSWKLFSFYTTYSTEKPSWEADSRLASWWIFLLLWYPKFRYRSTVTRSQTLFWTRQKQSTFLPTIFCSFVLMLYFHVRSVFSNCLLNFMSRSLYPFLISPFRAKHTAYLLTFLSP